MTTSRSRTVLLTDHAWPDVEVERAVVETAGFSLVSGPDVPAPTEVIEALVADYHPAAVLTCWAPVSAKAIATATELAIVARMGVGLDNIAVDAAGAHGVWVTNVPDYCVAEVSDHAVGLVLDWTRGISRLDRTVRGGQWNPAAARLRRLAQLTCGVVGYGRIGRESARKLRAFGATVLASDPVATEAADGVELVEYEQLLRRSDIVVLHAPLNPATRHMIGAEQLALMPPGALLVNVSRGGLVDTDAVIAALDGGHLGGAAFDVLESEPQVPKALLAHPGVVITPHVAFSSDAAVLELRRRAAEEVVRVLNGRPPAHPCNAPVSVRPNGVVR